MIRVSLGGKLILEYTTLILFCLRLKLGSINMALFSTGSCSEDQISTFCIIPVKHAISERRTPSAVPETEIKALKKALRDQQQLLQKLYFELEEEREAAATSANEALSMILRLQGEKATMKMEADQYQRMAEEKLFHAEQSVAAFEDLMYEKELEISTLEFRIEDYEDHLSSMGSSDTVFGDTGIRHLARGKCLSPIHKDSCFSAIEEDGFSAVQSADQTLMVADGKWDPVIDVPSFDTEEKSENYADKNPPSPYSEQIKKLDELTETLLFDRKARNVKNGFSPELSVVREDTMTEMDRGMLSESVLESEEFVSIPSSPSSSLQDIFEVPPIIQDQMQLPEKEESTLVVERENRLEKPDSYFLEAVESPNGVVKRMKKMGSCLIDGINVVCHCGQACASTVVAKPQAEILEYSRRVKQLEADKKALRQELIREGVEKMRLLREIHEQVNLIKSDIRSFKKPMVSAEENVSPLLLNVMEAMLHFWL